MGVAKGRKGQRMRRIVSVVTVVAIMAAIMAAMAMPAWADSPWTDALGTCTTTKQDKPGLLYKRDTNKEIDKCFVDPEQFDNR